ncbi:MAG: DUF3667 domain-containing protein [Gammaproteobacteria bacterium]
MNPPAQTPEWTCPSCGHAARLHYCAQCGERRQQGSAPGELQLARHLLYLPGGPGRKLWGTFYTLIRRPGELTAAWLEGRRTPYTPPLQLFLAVNFVFFIVQSLTGLNVFSLPLDTNLHNQDYSEFANRLLTDHLTAVNLSVAVYAPFYDNMERLLAKSLVIIMVPLFAVAVSVLGGWRRWPTAAMVFAGHFYAFLMVFLCVLFPVLSLVLLFLVKVVGWHFDLHTMDNVVSGVEFLACASYIYFAHGRVFSLHPVLRATASVLLVFAVLYILYAYRLILFLVTLHAT